MVSRLDRETSGVVVFAKNQTAGRVLQKAMQERRAAKTYLAIVEGVLGQPRIVEEPIGPDPASEFVSRRWVHVQGQFAATEFNPVAHRDSYTLVEIHPITGRRHQIRVHAAFIGYPIVGDKLYGPDAGLMLRFVAEGFTSELRERLRLDRQALHANKIEFPTVLPGQTFTAPFPKDLEVFWQSCKD
jgi:23S rRNA pseudouridine1911/1915/1917 synthase